jgi:glycosyltransferase involved in cell wall biosynthesis
MKVCIDIQPAIAQRAGIGRYTAQLAAHLGMRRSNHEIALFYFDFLRKGMTIPYGNATPRPVRWFPGRVARKAWSALGVPPFEFFGGKADVYHFTNFLLPPLKTGKAVVTIHDTSFLRCPETMDEKNLKHLQSGITRTVRRADAIITISKFTGSEVAELLKVEPDRIHPIHLGIGDEFRPRPEEEVASVKQTLGLDKPYILTVGTIEPRKNLPFMIDVFEKMTAFDGCLAIAGMPGWKYEKIFDRMKKSSRAEDIRYLGRVPEEQVPALYTGANLFMLTSLYEGFGFTPLEAMACGTPVVSSSAGSLPEVLGDCAAFVEGFDPGAWVEVAEKKLGNRSDSARGIEHASGYSWSETADQTWRVYEKVMS